VFRHNSVNYIKQNLTTSDWRKKEFLENGFVFLGELLPEGVFKDLEERVSIALAGAPAKDTNQSLLKLHWKDPWFLQICSRPEFVDVACSLLGERKVKIFSSLIVSKPPNSKMVGPVASRCCLRLAFKAY
jgi:hypothetical protein